MGIYQGGTNPALLLLQGFSKLLLPKLESRYTYNV